MKAHTFDFFLCWDVSEIYASKSEDITHFLMANLYKIRPNRIM